MKKKKVQKLLAVLLSASMVFGLTACGDSGSGTTNDTPNTDSATNETVESTDSSTNEGETETADSEGYAGPDWEAIDAMDYDEKSDALYDYNLGEFNEYYQVAKEEVTDLDKRMALMAVAEAKLLESGVFQPVQSNGGDMQ